MDKFRVDCEIRLRLTGYDYCFDSRWFGWKVHESGSKYEVTIKGKPGFCMAMIEYLIDSPNFKQKELRPTSRKVRIPIGDALKDQFRSENSFENFITGGNYQYWCGFSYQVIQGSSLHIRITGKSGFAKVIASRIHRFKERILRNTVSCDYRRLK